MLRDNAFALIAGLKIQIPADLRPRLSDESTEEELLLRFLQGDSEAFTQVVHRYLPQVQDRLVVLGLSHGLAREAAYDVFFAILKNRERISSPKDFLPHLFQTAKWKATDLTRRARRDANRNISLEELNKTEGYEGYGLNDIEDYALWPDEELMRKEYWHAVDQQVSKIDSAIAQLNLIEQSAIRRSLFDGAPASEIARENAMSIPKFYRVRHQAIAKLRKMLAGIRDLGQ